MNGQFTELGAILTVVPISKYKINLSNAAGQNIMIVVDFNY